MLSNCDIILFGLRTWNVSAGKGGINTATPDTKLQVVGDVKFGDDNTNYVTIDATGNLVFVGGGGLAFAEIYARDNTATTSLN